MKKIPLLFLAIGLTSCAPLPPLVTDPIDEPKAAETPSASSESASVAPESVPAGDSVTAQAAPDSAEVFAPIAPASAEALPKPETPKPYTAMELPPELQRDFRVGILVGVSKAEISGNRYAVSLREDDFPKDFRSGTLRLAPKREQVQYGNSTADSVWILSGDSSELSVGGKKYRGKILVVNNAKSLTVINVLPVEDYLKGVVPHEIGKLDESMFEALKVQAVAARTYAYRHFNSRISQGFDVYATVQDQVYNGSSGESPLTNAAIDSTKGIVLTYDEKLIEAYYHSTCGGYTEGVETWGLSPVPYLRSQNDMKNADSAWCTGPHSAWKKVYSEKELVSMFKRNFKEARAEGKSNFGGIQQIEIKSKFPGGRVNELEVLTDKGIFTVRGDRTRWLFKEGSKILSSSKFNIEKNGKVWVIDGSGFGHGIGMCQMGTRERAKAGQRFDEILLAYYPGTVLKCVQSAK